jgi:peptidoglycan-N-acetylglucosamine deacetylase
MFTLALYALPASAIAVGANYLPHAARYLVTRQIREKTLRGRSLVLTYDDGPGRALTPQVLDMLASSGSQATFFLLGKKAESTGDVMQRMKTEGHEIACHGYAHLNGWKQWPWRVARDVQEGYRALAPWMPTNALFRPPYGKLSLPGWLVVRRRGAALAWWTIDSGDTHAELPSPSSVAESVARDGGGVVLLHDFDRAPERARFVLATTELLVRTAQREGLTICRFGDLLTSPI